ncbi:hypothetical protein Hanom_Chr12g01124091 [Helianthus anomalus]
MSMNVLDFFQPYTQPDQFSMPGQFGSSGEGGSSQFSGYGYGSGQVSTDMGIRTPTLLYTARVEVVEKKKKKKRMRKKVMTSTLYWLPLPFACARV